MSAAGDVLDQLLDQLPTRDAIKAAQYRIEQLEAVERWAHAQLPIAVGDHVQLTGMASVLADAPGWRSYREALADGATAIVTEIRYARHRGWVASVVLDREWSVSDDAAYGPYWTGPGEPPEGYQDARRGEDDRRHTWNLTVGHLAPAPQSAAQP